MAALVKGLSGSATFRSPAGSWVMRVSYKRGRASLSDARSASQLGAQELRRAR